jgi:hypothetical protein
MKYFDLEISFLLSQPNSKKYKLFQQTIGRHPTLQISTLASQNHRVELLDLWCVFSQPRLEFMYFSLATIYLNLGSTGCSFATYMYNLLIREGYSQLYGPKQMAKCVGHFGMFMHKKKIIHSKKNNVTLLH